MIRYDESQEKNLESSKNKSPNKTPSRRTEGRDDELKVLHQYNKLTI